MPLIFILRNSLLHNFPQQKFLNSKDLEKSFIYFLISFSYSINLFKNCIYTEKITTGTLTLERHIKTN